MKSLLNFFNSIRDAFESPNLPMDSDYNYLARQREAERIRTAHQLRSRLTIR